MSSSRQSFSLRPPLCARRTAFAPSPLQSPLVASSLESPPLSLVKLSPIYTFQLSLFAGALAGFTVDAVLFPLDTLKTRLQLSTSTSATLAKPPPLFKGLYAGFGPAVAASAPAAAAFFAVYDQVKKILEPRVTDDRYTPLVHVAAAAAGDIAGSTVRLPFEVIKQRVQSGMYSSAMDACRKTLATEGIPGFFSGYGSLIMRELPFDAIQFPLYELLKARWRKMEGRVTELETWKTSVCGSLAGGASAAITTPLDVVKTRLMTQGDAGKYRGIIHGLRTIAQEEGPAALMSGVAPRVIWISVGGAVFFGAYEGAKKLLFPVLAKKQLEEESIKESKQM